MSLLSFIFKHLKKYGPHKANKDHIDFDPKKLNLNVIPSPKDDRDYKLSERPGLKALRLPRNYNMLKYTTFVKNQGSLGACTGFAGVAAVDTQRVLQNNEVLDFSELFIYYNERVIDGTVNEDAGSYIRTLAKTLKETGVALEQYHPYDVSKFKEKPGFPAYFGARFFRIKNYYRVMNIDECKQAIANNIPVVIGMIVYSNLFNYSYGVYSSIAGNKAGGHAICVVGYDDDSNCVIIKNSWGRNWGEEGYFRMSYDMYNQLVFEAFALDY